MFDNMSIKILEKISLNSIPEVISWNYILDSNALTAIVFLQQLVELSIC